MSIQLIKDIFIYQPPDIIEQVLFLFSKAFPLRPSPRPAFCPSCKQPAFSSKEAEGGVVAEEDFFVSFSVDLSPLSSRQPPSRWRSLSLLPSARNTLWEINTTWLSARPHSGVVGVLASRPSPPLIPIWQRYLTFKNLPPTGFEEEDNLQIFLSVFFLHQSFQTDR